MQPSRFSSPPERVPVAILHDGGSSYVKIGETMTDVSDADSVNVLRERTETGWLYVLQIERGTAVSLVSITVRE